MTSKEAYIKWSHKNNGCMYDAFDLWTAACEYQKEKDADIALKVASSFGAPDAYWIFADTIRDQEC